MDLESLRRGRRLLSAAVSLSAVGLVMAKLRAGEAVASSSGAVWVLASCFVISMCLLVAVWRKEHRASELAFAERERQQLALLKLQVELQKGRGARPDEHATSEESDGQA